MFFKIATAIWLSLHTYLAWRFVPPAPSLGTRIALFALIAFCATMTPLSFYMFGRTSLGGAADAFRWAAYVTMGISALLFTLTLTRDIVWGLSRAGYSVAKASSTYRSELLESPERRTALLHAMNLGILGAVGALGTVGLYEARRRPQIRRVEVRIPGLATPLDGFTIAHITDLHVGPTIRHDWVQAVVEATNAVRADAIALTGDMIDGAAEELRAHLEPLRSLRATHGVFYVTGNHEYYSGGALWWDEFARLGAKPLRNAHEVVSHNGAQLVFGGVPDWTAGQFDKNESPDANVAFAGAPSGATKILLAHQPRAIDNAVEAGVTLQLSGHTHGGQLIPWNFFVPLQQPFVRGLNKRADTFCYTSCGTGYWGPPIRLGAPSEIALITLRREDEPPTRTRKSMLPRPS